MDQLVQKKNTGFSTIELMIAMGIMVLVLTAVVMTSFGSQSFLIGSQTSAESIKIAQGIIEQEQALARKDFNLVNATTLTNLDPTGLCQNGYLRYSATNIYCYRIDVKNHTDTSTGKTDYSSKEVTIHVTWKDEHGQWKTEEQMTKITTLVANLDNVSSSNTCNSSPSGDWTAPIMHSYPISSLGATGNYSISDIDAFKDKISDKLYVSTTNNTGNNFYILNLSSNGVPSSENSIDTTGSSLKGPAAFTVISPSKLTSGQRNTYAFIANGVTPANWGTCGTTPPIPSTCSQFQVLDVSTPASLSTIVNLKIPSSGITANKVTGTTGQGVGKSIYYSNGYVFLGLTKTGTGPEFHIIDVHDPLTPIAIGSYPVGATVNAIYISGKYAYLATTYQDGNSLMILDITNPTAPVQVWPKPVPSSSGFGNALTAVGDILYFGMTANGITSTPEIINLNNANPSTTSPSVNMAKSLKLSLSIGDLIIRDNLINILFSNTNTLRIRDTASNTDISNIILSGNGSALDCQGNYLYAGDDSGSITSVTGS